MNKAFKKYKKARFRNLKISYKYDGRYRQCFWDSFDADALMKSIIEAKP